MASPAPYLELRAVGKSYGPTVVLAQVDLTIREREFVVILGPSGSGKTTILRLIAGFIAPSRGEILLSGRPITGVPVNRRPFNTVFQDYALFPHMTVAQNVGFGLSVRRRPQAEIAARTADVLELVSMSPFAARYPAQLSGGQKQRVALARAIVCEPRLILLDEPFAALDVDLRRQMQMFLKELQGRIATTFVFITHDQEEAITLADKICVMDAGRILQSGAPRDLYDRPENPHVARFFGDNNLISGRIGARSGSLAFVDTPLGRLRAACGGGDAGDAVLIAVRPEYLSLTGHSEAVPPGGPRIPGLVQSVRFSGAVTHVRFQPDAGEALHIKMLSGTAIVAEGARATVTWPEATAWVVAA